VPFENAVYVMVVTASAEGPLSASTRGMLVVRLQLWPVFTTSGSCLAAELDDGRQIDGCVRFQVFV